MTTNLRPAVLRLIACTFLLGSAACSDSSAPDRPSRAVPVESAAVRQETFTVKSHYPAEVVGSSTDIAAQVAGTIQSIAVRVGDRVAPGTPLVTIDDRYLRQEVLQAQAQTRAAAARVLEAKANLESAELELQRSLPLAADQLIAPHQLDVLKLRVRTAAAAVSAAEAEHQRAAAAATHLEQQLADSIVKAPHDGVISDRYIEPGQLVQPTSPLLRLVRDRPLWVRFRIPERDLAHIHIGTELAVILPSHPETSVTGVVAGIAGEVSRSDRLTLVEGKLPQPPEGIRSGMFGQVTVNMQTLEQVFVLPVAALIERVDPQDRAVSGVFALRDNKAVWTDVQQLGIDATHVAVTGPLTTGDRVATMGHHTIADGTTILDTTVGTVEDMSGEKTQAP